MAEAQWYVVHTYSGYENKVKVDLEKTIENRKLQDVIMEVSVPMIDSIEMKNGVRKKVQKKMLPGYVLVRMIMNDDTWYVVRNTRCVTGFVGPGSKPVPLTEQEVRNMGVNRENEEFEFVEGETVTVLNGAWINTQGVIKAINAAKQTLTITVEMFGRETPVEIAFEDVKVEHY
jgi:transcriptional antiterminator NusG